jgi:hypothetical protein
VVLGLLAGLEPAQGATDFTGTVLLVDPGSGKLSVKKEDGGTRFSFVVNAKTQFEGASLKALKDLKKGDVVTVQYEVSGSQYIAQKIIAKPK